MSNVAAAIRRGGVVYPVANSVVFDEDMFLEPTAATGSNTIYTTSMWVKRSGFQQDQMLIRTGLPVDIDNTLDLKFYDDSLWLVGWDGVTFSFQLTTTSLYRDPSTWAHIVYSIDTTQSTASDRLKLYYDGIQISDFSIERYPDQNSTVDNPTRIGAQTTAYRQYFGYISEVVCINGQALTPDSFGRFIDGKWLPKKVSGLDYSGVNSFYLPFTDPLNIGKDASGNGNDWLATNLTPDSVVTDTPTNNCCTWNPVWQGVQAIYSDGNRDSEASAIAQWKKSQGTFAFQSSGKWYFEVTCVWVGNGVGVGIATSDPSAAKYIIYLLNGKIAIDGVESNYGSSFTTGALIGIAYDADNNTLQFFNAGIAQPILSDIYVDTFFPNHTNSSSSLGSKLLAHFNEDEFTYAPPEGFKALMEKYL